MRPFPLAALLLAGILLPGTFASAARAAECGPLAERIVAATQAEIGERRPDFVTFRAGPETSLTLSCASAAPSSVGVQYRGEHPPETYYGVFGRAGEAVTGIAANLLQAAAREAAAKAARLRHSNVEAGGALVTCAAMALKDGPLTMCAVIEKDERS